MKMIVGLGNVGMQHAETRHNIGWVVVDSLAHEHDIELKAAPKLKAMIGKGKINGENVLLVKPTTMMNKSGEAVQAVGHFYKIPREDIMVIYDDLDIMFGSVKIKQGGSGGSHNGLNSVIDHIGPDFWRMRIGIDRQPRGIEAPADFVLAKFVQEEETKLDKLIATSLNELSSQILSAQVNTVHFL